MKKKREMTLREYLSKTQANRFEEELTRPRVEIWPDEWSDWVSAHSEDQYNFACFAEGRASPFCPQGYH